MSGLFNLLAAVGPQLFQYFTKNKGLNTVSGGVLGSFLTLLVLAFQQEGTINQIITFLQNQGEAGLIGGAVVAGLRVAVMAYAASKAK
jgi:hypothetical protein